MSNNSSNTSKSTFPKGSLLLHNKYPLLVAIPHLILSVRLSNLHPGFWLLLLAPSQIPQAHHLDKISTNSSVDLPLPLLLHFPKILPAINRGLNKNRLFSLGSRVFQLCLLTLATDLSFRVFWLQRFDLFQISLCCTVMCYCAWLIRVMLTMSALLCLCAFKPWLTHSPILLCQPLPTHLKPAVRLLMGHLQVLVTTVQFFFLCI